MKPTELAALPTFAELEDEYILKLLEATEGNVTLAAKVSGMGRSTLYRKVKQLGIRTCGDRSSERRAAFLQELTAQREKAWALLQQAALGSPETHPTSQLRLDDPLLAEATERWEQPIQHEVRLMEQRQR